MVAHNANAECFRLASTRFDYLLVAGGGGAGNGQGGGGGAGGYIYQTSQAITAGITTYTVTVGAAGAAGASLDANVMWHK